MYQSDLDSILPKLGGNVRGEKNIPYRRSILRRIAGETGRKSGFSLRGGHPKRGYKACHTRTPRAFYQRCIVKARIVKMKSSGKKVADLHLNYIQRDGVEKDGSKGKLYGPEKSLDKKNFSREIKEEPHQFRFIVSPENAHDLDLTDFTKQLMKQMEKDLGRKLEWAAVNHYNTDNPHSHIVVRGLDADGREVRIDREYISNGIRNRAVEIATNELGLRSEYEIEKQIERDIKAERFTGLDYKLDKMADHSSGKALVDLGEYPKGRYARIDRLRLISRLETLRSLGLAENTGGSSWMLSDEWKASLRDLGSRNDIIKTMHRRLEGDPSRYSIVNNEIDPLSIEGRLTAKGLSNELYDKYYLIVEGTNGRSHYIDANRGINLDDLREGNIVSLRVERDRWFKRSDKNIAAVAAKNNGIYSTDIHLENIGSPKIKILNKNAKPGDPEYLEIKSEDFVKSHERRLYRLRQIGLAEKLDAGSWKIASNLTDELKRRDRETPINRISVGKVSELSVQDQIKYKGRAWIDSFVSDPSSDMISKNGFGADVSRAARLRSKFLMDIGATGSVKEINAKLDKLESDAYANNLSKRSQMTYRRMQTMLRIKGSLLKTNLESGQVVAVVSDSKSKEFTMVPWKKKYEKLLSGNEILLPKVVMDINKSGGISIKRFEKTIGR